LIRWNNLSDGQTKETVSVERNYDNGIQPTWTLDDFNQVENHLEDVTNDKPSVLLSLMQWVTNVLQGIWHSPVDVKCTSPWSICQQSTVTHICVRNTAYYLTLLLDTDVTTQTELHVYRGSKTYTWSSDMPNDMTSTM